MGEKNNVPDLPSLMKVVQDHQQQLKDLQGVSAPLQQVAEAVGVAKSNKTPRATWSLGLSDSETDDTLPQDKETDEFLALFNEKPGSSEIHDDDSMELADILKDVEQPLTFGPLRMPKIAEAFTKTASRPLNKENATKIRESIKIPDNCKQFTVPKMNAEIWAQLPTGSRITDIQWQQVQQTMSTGLTALAVIADEVGKNSSGLSVAAKTRF
jgi:hypothetical protein